MRILIDATASGSRLDVFGMTLLERQLHSIVSAGLKPEAVHVVLAPGAPKTPPARASLPAELPIRWSSEPGSLDERILGVLREGAAGPLLVLDGTCVIDTRLLHAMAAQSGTVAARGGTGNARAAVLRVEGLPFFGDHGEDVETDLLRLVDRGIARGSIEDLPLASIPSYVKKLRRDLPIYLFRVTDVASRDEAERFLFWSNYKGSTDFFTKYVYPPFVWRMVGPLSRWRVHPNVISTFNVGITFMAVFLWAWNWWWFGFVLAYTMSVLDSVDGKLARLTFTSSWVGDILDHGLDIVHPPFWYLAWAWGLSDGNTASSVFQAALCMALIYTLDRIVAGVFNRRLRRSIHGYTRLDERMRTFVSRRNINLPLFLVGWLLGVPVEAFMLIVLWQVVCFVFHLERLVQFWNSPPAPQAALQ